MSQRYLLDTNIVSEPARRRPQEHLVRRLRALASDCAIAAPTWHELHYGILRLPSSRRRTALAEYVQLSVRPSFPVLPYDEAAAEWHAGERARLERMGKPSPFVDGQIAAIAVVNGLTLVTRNVRDFMNYRGLRVDDWEG